jgi:RNA polymerase sigma-70 factor (ECF subfamily)
MHAGRPDADGRTDAELVARLRTDPDALEAFYRAHVSAVAAFVARRVSSADEVADVVSNTFLAAIHGADGYDPARSPVTARYWLLGIARRQVADHYGSSGRDGALAEREASRRRLSDDETARIDELIDAQRLAPNIEAALATLSPTVRDAFVLVAVDGFPQKAAAGELGISHAALRARLARARLHLRRHLEATERSRLGGLALATTPAAGGSHGL